MTQRFRKAFEKSIALKLLLAGSAIGAAWIGGALIGRWQTVREADALMTASSTEHLQESQRGRPLDATYFTSGPGRELVRASHSRPIALLLIEWSECLYCAAQMVEWGTTARRFPSVPAYEILTRRLPPDVARFLEGTAAPVPVIVDSTLDAGDGFPVLPAYLLLHKGIVKHVLVGKDKSWRFWSDVSEIVGDSSNLHDDT